MIYIFILSKHFTRFTATLAITLLFSSHSFSQSLAGEWKGSFIGDAMYEKPIPFALHFALNKDSSYKVYSYSLVYNPMEQVSETLVSEVACRLTGTDSIYLEETKQVKPKTGQGCLQKFALAIKKKNGKMILEGTWSYAQISTKCGDETGTVSLTKK